MPKYPGSQQKDADSGRFMYSRFYVTPRTLCTALCKTDSHKSHIIILKWFMFLLRHTTKALRLSKVSFIRTLRSKIPFSKLLNNSGKWAQQHGMLNTASASTGPGSLYYICAVNWGSSPQINLKANKIKGIRYSYTIFISFDLSNSFLFPVKYQIL